MVLGQHILKTIQWEFRHTSYQDYNEVKDWIKGTRSESPEAIQEGRNLIPIELSLDTMSRGGPYDGVMSLLVLNGAKDFGTFESINVHQVDDHHIFPNAQLKKGLNGNSYDKTERNKILNRTIIQYRNNRFKYGDALPSVYIPEMIEEHPRGEQGIRELLQDHFINDEAFQALLNDDYETFCEARKQAIRQTIEDGYRLVRHRSRTSVTTIHTETILIHPLTTLSF